MGASYGVILCLLGDFCKLVDGIPGQMISPTWWFVHGYMYLQAPCLAKGVGEKLPRAFRYVFGFSTARNCLNYHEEQYILSNEM